MVLIKTLNKTHFSILVTMMKGKQSPEYEEHEQLYNKGETMLDKPPNIRSLKTAALTGGKPRLSKSSNYKQTFILWSFVLHVFSFSVQHFAHLRGELHGQICLVLISAQRCYFEHVQHQSQRQPRQLRGLCLKYQDHGIEGPVLKCQDQGTILNCFYKSITVPFHFKIHMVRNGGTCSDACHLSAVQAIWTLSSACLGSKFSPIY